MKEDDYHAISPNDLLLGRAAGPRKQHEAEVPKADLDAENKAKEFLAQQELLCEKWWKQWSQIAFPLFAPRRKWTNQFRNVCKGDIVLLQYDAKVSRERYRLAKVADTHPDNCGVVRTVTVVLRPRHAREKALPYKSKELTEFPVTVQRLVVIVPVEEQQQLTDDIVTLPEQELKEIESRGEDEGNVAPTEPISTRRRSRRLRNQDPESVLGVTTRETLFMTDSECDQRPSSVFFSLYKGALPVEVPAWLPDVLASEDTEIYDYNEY